VREISEAKSGSVAGRLRRSGTTEVNRAARRRSRDILNGKMLPVQPNTLPSSITRDKLGTSSPGRPSNVRLPHDHLDDPISAHMSRDVTTVRQDETVGEVLAHLRGQPLGAKIVYIYVLDASGKLVGVLPTRHLLSSDPGVVIASIMIPRVITLFYLTSVLAACKLFMESRLLALPVVDEEHKLVGAVDISLFTDEIAQISERYSYEDVFQLIGLQMTTLDKPSAWSEFYARFPWLLCNVAGGLACALLASRYEQLLDTVVILALFIPVVLALAESVGMQSMTITLQRLHGEVISSRDVVRAVGRELLVAAGLGTGCGAVVGAVIWFWKGTPAVALAVSVSIALAMITSCLLAVVLPSTVHAMKVDPRIAAGPIVLASADLATLLFYFHLSLALL
jgi:magnesium transporter